MKVEVLANVTAYPNGVDKLVLSKGSSVELESFEADFLLKRDLVKEIKPAPVKKKETKPLKKKKETK